MSPLVILLPNSDPANWILSDQFLGALQKRRAVSVLVADGALTADVRARLALHQVPVLEFKPSQPSQTERRVVALLNQVFMQRVGGESVDMLFRLARAYPKEYGIFRTVSPSLGRGLGALGLATPLATLAHRLIDARASRVDPAIASIPAHATVLHPYLRAQELAPECRFLKRRGCRVVANLGGWDPLEYAGWIPDIAHDVIVWNHHHHERLLHHYPARPWHVRVTGQFKFAQWTEAASRVAQERPPTGRLLFVDSGMGGSAYDREVLPRLCASLKTLPESKRPEVWRKPYGPSRGTEVIEGVEVVDASEASVARRWPECAGEHWKHALTRKCSLVVGGGSTLQLESVLCGTPTATLTLSNFAVNGQALFGPAHFLDSHQRAIYAAGRVPLLDVNTPWQALLSIATNSYEGQLAVATEIAYGGVENPLRAFIDVISNA